MIINEQTRTKMKNILQFIFALFFIFNLSSCYTTEKITVYGKPGTEVYTPNKEKISEINGDGKAKVILSSDACYTYLLSKDVNSNMYIPFALDYKNKSYAGTKFLNGTAMFITGGGFLLELAGVIALCAGDDESGSMLCLSGAAPLLLGGITGSVTSSRLDQKNRQWQFKYLKNQQTNSDLNFTRPFFSEQPKRINQSDSPSKQLAATGWEQKQNNIIKLPFKEGTFDVIQVVTHFNDDYVTMTPSGKVSIKDNSINISIHGNKILKDKTIKITKDLRRNKKFGEPERTYKLYKASDGKEIGIYFDDSLEAMGVLEQKILISVENSISFEIAWM